MVRNARPYAGYVSYGGNMGIFSFIKLSDINKNLEEIHSTPGAVLLDVRDIQEYSKGHIPGAISIPLDNIDRVKNIVMDVATPVFVYCYSGRRSSKAVNAMRKMGYRNVKNIGGIVSYRGKLI